MSEKSFPNIEFSRLRQLVVIDLPEKLDEVTYVANATNFRRALLSQHGKDDLNVRKLIQENEDTRLTFCGHSRFLFNDLRYIFPRSESRGSNQYKRDVKFLAREMIRRGFVSFSSPPHSQTLLSTTVLMLTKHRPSPPPSKRTSPTISASPSTNPRASTRYPSASFRQNHRTPRPGCAASPTPSTAPSSAPPKAISNPTRTSNSPMPTMADPVTSKKELNRQLP